MANLSTLTSLSGPDSITSGPNGRFDPGKYNAFRTWLYGIKAFVLAFFYGTDNARDYGATGDGVTLDTTAFQSLLGKAVVDVPPGTYLIDADLTFTGYLRMAPGAKFVGSGGVRTVTLSGGFLSRWRGQHFGTNITAVFSAKHNHKCFPQWFGALVNVGDSTSGAANDAALAAAYATGLVVDLGRADYWINTTLVIPEGSTTIGVNGTRGTGGAKGMTRILIRSKTATVAKIGVVADPGSINSYAKNIHAENIEFARDTGTYTLTPPAAGSEFTGAAGVEFVHCLYVHCKNLWSRENQIGFLFNGAVNLRMDDCFAERSIPCDVLAVNPDFWIGAAFNGSSDLAALSTGGNVSIMLKRCNFSLGGTVAATGGAPIASTMLSVNGPCSDLWLDTVEGIQCQKGLEIAGTSDTSGHRLNAFIDVSIMNCKFDQVTSRGLYLHDLPTGANVSIASTYVALGGSSPISCFEVRDSGGTVTIDKNCQAVCNSAPDAVGLYLHNASGVRAELMIEDSQRPVVAETGCADCDVRPIINTTEDATIAPVQGAIETTASVRVHFAPRIKTSVTTGAKKYPYGIRANGSANVCTYDISAIDPAALTGSSSALRLVVNGSNVTQRVGATSQIIATGSYTTPSDSTIDTVYWARILGGGGGSGGANAGTAAGGGGGSGEYREVIFSGYAPNTAITVTIGAAGTAGANTGGDGGDGGDTSIALTSGTVTAGGGKGGKGGPTAQATAGGAGGTGGGGTAVITVPGGAGEPAYPSTKGGAGASSPFGRGGYGGGNFTGVGANAAGYGSGGGGSAGTTAAGKTGSAGLALVVRLTP